MGRIILSICAVVVAMGLAGVSPPQGKTGEQPGQAAQPQQQSAPPAASPQAADAKPLEAACDQGEANRDSDLCAQWYAADSAYEASIWTRRTGWFTGIGLIVGAITMGAAICAALFARDAAEHTKDGAKAAWAAEKVTRESAERQLRAYIHVSRVEMHQYEVGKHPVFGVEIMNAGQTPAYEVTINADAAIWQPGHDLFEVRPSEVAAFTLGPGLPSGKIERVAHPVSAEEYQAVVQKQVEFHFFGIVRYLDGFGARRETLFAYRYDPDQLTANKSMIIRQTGNTAT